MANNSHIKEILINLIENDKKISDQTISIYSSMIKNNVHENISEHNTINTKDELWFAESQAKRTTLFEIPEILIKEHRRSIDSMLNDIQKQINMTSHEHREDVTKDAIQKIHEKTSQIIVPEKPIIAYSMSTKKRPDTATALSAESSSRLLTSYWSQLYEALGSALREIQADCIKNRVVGKDFWWHVDYATVDINNDNRELAEKITQGINSSSVPFISQYLIKNTVVECVKTAMKEAGNEINSETYNAPTIEAQAQYDGLVAGWYMAKALCTHKPSINKSPKPK